MKILKYIALAMPLFTACSEQGLDTFTSSQASVYFAVPSQTTTYADSTVFSFLEVIENVDTLEIPVALLGLPSSSDRLVDFEVVDTATNAVQGVHYEIINDRLLAAAGEVTTTLKLALYRHESLQEQDFALNIALKANEWFTVAPREEIINITTGEKVTLHSHKIVITGKVVPPSEMKWRLAGFGTYSIKKHLLVNEINNINAKDWDSAYASTVSIWRIKTRNHLQREYDKGKPIYEDSLDENGEKVLMRVDGVNY